MIEGRGRLAIPQVLDFGEVSPTIMTFVRVKPEVVSVLAWLRY
jgi:hypothetical protein